MSSTDVIASRDSGVAIQGFESLALDRVSRSRSFAMTKWSVAVCFPGAASDTDQVTRSTGRGEVMQAKQQTEAERRAELVRRARVLREKIRPLRGKEIRSLVEEGRRY